MKFKEMLAIANIEVFLTLLYALAMTHDGIGLSIVLTVSRLIACQTYIWLTLLSAINLELKITSSAILLVKELLILFLAIYFKKTKLNHKVEYKRLIEKNMDIISVLDHSE